MTTMETTRRSRTNELVINALFIALTLVATWLINIRLPFVGSGGLIHLGNVPLFVGAQCYMAEKPAQLQEPLAWGYLT